METYERVHTIILERNERRYETGKVIKEKKDVSRYELHLNFTE